MSKHLLPSLGLVAASLALAPSVAHAGDDGCAGGNSGWARMLVTEAATTMLPHLLAPMELDELTAAIGAGSDKNGDGTVCMTTRWGDHLNEKSHWARVGMTILGEQTVFFIVVDNASDNAAKG